MALLINGHNPSSVFGLFGTKENAATFAIGWALAQSPALRKQLLPLLTVNRDFANDVSVELQRHAEDGGYTDIEVRAPNQFHSIIEAKKGWALPSSVQLTRYIPRLAGGDLTQAALITISSADKAYASSRLPSMIKGVSVPHVSWSDVQRAVRVAHAQAAGLHEKLWLRELNTHLEAYVSVQNPSDNSVYVVALSPDRIRRDNPYTWIDVVEMDHSYFHPVGISGWPVVPPNYIGFRYRGQLQSVHHVEGFRVVRNLADYNRFWPDGDGDEHFIYNLGPPMRPASRVATGNIFRAGRVWCAIDTLLSGEFKTISDARDESKRRISEFGQIAFEAN